jgi:hypothetical protein
MVFMLRTYDLHSSLPGSIVVIEVDVEDSLEEGDGG